MFFHVQWTILIFWTFNSCGDAWLDGSRTQHYPTCSRTDTKSDRNGKFQYIGQFNTQDYCLFIKNTDSSAVTIRFGMFDFGTEDENGNCSNFVEVGSPGDYAPKRYCGDRMPPSYYTKSGPVWIWIHTESRENVRMPDVLLYYWKVLTCDQDVKVSLFTFIASPDYPQPAPEHSSCTWRVRSSDNLPMQIQLTDWGMFYSDIVGFAMFHAQLDIYDGEDSDGTLLASFSEYDKPDEVKNKVVTTTGPRALLVFTTGEDDGYIGAKFNATVKVKGYCMPGTYSCGDGSTCYDKSHKCNGNRDCTTGYDELGCNGCPPSQFWCGIMDDSCYTHEQFCNGMKDCKTSSEDEKYCESCGPGAFLCAADKRCIYDRWKCDGGTDCSDRSDEEDCPYTASRRVITATVIGALVCSLLLVIALGCTCKLYSIHSHTSNRLLNHLYRATPLSRLEREMFQRQAPPTYDMTVNGARSDQPPRASSGSRRHRNRRPYQFQRSMPANAGNVANDNRANEEIVADATPPNTQPTTGARNPSSPSNEQNVEPSASVRQSVASFVFESVPDILAEMLSGTQSHVNNQGQATTPTESTTPQAIATRDSGTQTNPNSPHSSTATTPRGSAPDVMALAAIGATSSSYSERRSERSRNRSRRRGTSSSRSNSKKDQAKPLPKKKKIQPVMVPAPCPDSLVEDTLTCVYPCPPSYSQAIASGSPKVDPVNMGGNDDESPQSTLSNSVEQEPPQVPASSPMPVSPKSTPVSKSKFPFSLTQAIRSIATSPFSKFQKNSYSQLENMDAGDNGREDSNSQDHENQSEDAPSQPKRSRESQSSVTSSDDDLIDVAAGPEMNFDPASETPRIDPDDTPPAPAQVKVFPPKKNGTGRTSIRPDLRMNEDRNSLELSDFSFSEDV